MLDGYVTEKEQLEEMGKWWKENGKWITVAIIVGLILGFGWRYYHKIETRRLENASTIYQSILGADKQTQFKTAQDGAAILIKNFPKTPYASLAAMISAQESVAQNKLTIALDQLNWVIKNSSSARQKQIARINAARILLSQNKTQDAISMLNTINDKTFMPLIDLVKGDIATKMGDAKSAQADYENAKSGLSDFPPATQLLNMKLAN